MVFIASIEVAELVIAMTMTSRKLLFLVLSVWNCSMQHLISPHLFLMFVSGCWNVGGDGGEDYCVAIPTSSPTDSPTYSPTDCMIARRQLVAGGNQGPPHHRRIAEDDGGVGVHVQSEDADRLFWLKDHVLEMRGRMESGAAAREWDPLFEALFKNANDINLECESSNDGLTCTHTSTTQCGLDLIEALNEYHNEIAFAVLESEDTTIENTHAVPESCK